MRLRLASIVAVFFVFSLSVAHAQYVEIYRLDNLTKTLPDSQVLSSLSSDLSLPADRLRQEKAEYKVTFGELYLAHQFAKASNSDVKSMMAEVRAKSWGGVVMERKIDMERIKDNTRKLEKALREGSSKK